jgi:hypothetical protein
MKTSLKGCCLLVMNILALLLLLCWGAATLMLQWRCREY